MEICSALCNILQVARLVLIRLKCIWRFFTTFRKNIISSLYVLWTRLQTIDHVDKRWHKGGLLIATRKRRGDCYGRNILPLNVPTTTTLKLLQIISCCMLFITCNQGDTCSSRFEGGSCVFNSSHNQWTLFKDGFCNTVGQKFPFLYPVFPVYMKLKCNKVNIHSLIKTKAIAYHGNINGKHFWHG